MMRPGIRLVLAMQPHCTSIAMSLRNILAHRPLVLPLATAGALAMVAISELAYRQTVGTLAQLAPALLQQPGLGGTLQRSLQLGRIGVVVLSLISLVALFLLHRQGLALAQQQALRQRRAQAENLALEAEVALRTAELVALAQHLQTAREDERARLARDLHDELGALLTAAKLDAARIRMRLAGTAPEALERLAHLVASLDGVIALKRSISENLYPSALRQLGLVPTLQNLAEEFALAAGIPVHCALQPVQLQPSAALMVFRLVQESITNISKYAQASQVWLALHQAGDQVRLEVRDDGVGFDPAALPRRACGLVGMRYRVQAEQGSLRLSTALGEGTCIEVLLPAAQAA
jgi:signal transduction histidine kinase